MIIEEMPPDCEIQCNQDHYKQMLEEHSSVDRIAVQAKNLVESEHLGSAIQVEGDMFSEPEIDSKNRKKQSVSEDERMLMRPRHIEFMEVDGVESDHIAENYQDQHVEPESHVLNENRSKALEATYAAVNNVIEDNVDILECGNYCIKIQNWLIVLDNDDDEQCVGVATNPYKCSICSKTYKSEAGFINHIKGHNIPEENDLIFHEMGDTYHLIPYHSITNKNDIRCIYTVPLRDDSNEIVHVAVGQTASSDVIWNATSNVAKAFAIRNQKGNRRR